MTLAGLEPAIPGSVDRCLIHWATKPDAWICRNMYVLRSVVPHLRCLAYAPGLMCVWVGVWLGLVVAWSAAWLRVWPRWGACGVVRGWLLRVHVGAWLGWVLLCVCCVVCSVLHLRFVVRDAVLVLCCVCCVACPVLRAVCAVVRFWAG